MERGCELHPRESVVPNLSQRRDFEFGKRGERVREKEKERTRRRRNRRLCVRAIHLRAETTSRIALNSLGIDTLAIIALGNLRTREYIRTRGISSDEGDNLACKSLIYCRRGSYARLLRSQGLSHSAPVHSCKFIYNEFCSVNNASKQRVL